MAYQPINLGTVDDDATGDDLKTGGDKINDNFVELYANKADKASPTLTGIPAAPTAAPGTNTTQIATTAYADAAVAAAVTGLLDFKGNTDCSANPNYPAASKGDAYIVSVAGKIGGASGTVVDIGDVYFASADNAGGTQAAVGTSWSVLEHNLAGALLSANNLSDVANAGTARTNLGLGTMATQAASAVSISGGSVTGITDITVADGGTGASTAAAARTNLGLEIGTDVSGVLDIQEFAASGTYTKPAGAKAVRVILFAGGGGGGGGGKAATSTIVSGGGAGGGGGSCERMFDASLLAGTVTVTVGTGGGGGTGATVNGPGNNGVAGGDTSFGTHAKAWGGGFGAGGNASVAAGGGAGGSERANGGNASGATNGSNTNSVAGAAGNANSTSPTGGGGGAVSPATGAGGGNSPFSVCAGGGGAGGGGLTAANAESTGGGGVAWRLAGSAAGGTVGGGNGGNATAVTDWGPGYAGGGGGSSESGNGGNGGTSGRAAGGSGGGASHGGNGGNGSAGGDGYAVVITYR